jgi:SAM-dependent methyltransferase
MRFDRTGKITLDHIYNQPDPRKYFQTLRELSYSLPQLAKPYFLKVFQAYREAEGRELQQVVDIGCSYGINAALLKCDATMDELYNRYGHRENAQTRDTLLERDRALVQSRKQLADVRFVGLDVSQPAVDYALQAGLLDAGATADLEHHDASQELRAILAQSDVVISTGCIGYVTERTLARVATATGDRRPWMANFVLRMFPFEPIDRALSDLGYETRQIKQLFKQRRFASQMEQDQILDTLADAKVDPKGYETDGWLYAQLHLSRPREVAKVKDTPLLAELFAS